MRKYIAQLLAFFFAVKVFGTAPNVVIIVTDDQGWGDVGYHTPAGQVPIQTPTMDSFATSGIRLERFYATAVCSVTRSALLTGRNSIRTGTNNTRGVPLGEHLMSQSFKAAGYQTFVCGKWHLGGSDKNLSYTTVNGRNVRIIQEGLEYAPYNRGWASHYGQYSGAIDYFTHRSAEGENLDVPDWWLDGVQQDGSAEHTDSQGNGGWSPDLLADKAISHIQNRDPAKPMLLYLAFNSIHGPVSAPSALITKYQNLGVTSTGRRSIAAAVEGTDQAMGRVLAALDAAGIANNTLVVWFGDNGGDEDKGSLNDPLRGTKGDGYDGAIREVAGIKWPGVLPAGVISNQLVWVGDLFPTLCAATGVTPLNTKPFDGLNLWPALLAASNTTAATRPSPMVTSTAIPSAFHTFTDPVNGGSKLFKLIRNRVGQTTVNELFNLTDDPYETTDLLAGVNVAGYASIVSTLSTAITSIAVETPVPYIGPPLISNFVTQGGTITLYAPFTSYKAPSVQWRKVGSPVAGGTFSQVTDTLGNLVTGAYTTTLTLTGVTLADAGSYDVVVTNATGSTTSAAGTLTVTAPVAPTIVGVSTAPTAPTYLDEVTVLAQVVAAPGSMVSQVQLSYELGVPVSRDVFRETFSYTGSNAWNGTGAQNAWTVMAANTGYVRQSVGTANRTAPVALASCITNGTAQVTCASTAALWPGMRVTGPTIAAGTSVLRINSATSFDLTTAATDSGTGQTLTAAGMTLTNATINGTTTVTCDSTVGLVSGMSISGTGMANNAAISSVNADGRTFLLNTAATGSNTGLTLVASGAAAEFQTGTANLADAMFATTNAIDCTSSAGYVEFNVQTRDLAAGDQWTFQTSADSGTNWATRIAEMTAVNHGFQLYHYDLVGAELGPNTRLRFQFAGHAVVAPTRPPRVDVDDITVATTSLPPSLTVAMFDDGLHGDGAAGDGIYAAQIPPQTGGVPVNYRIIATGGNGNSTTSPAASSFAYTVNTALTDSLITNAEFLGIPTDSGITLNVASSADLEAYVEYGTAPFSYTSATAPALYPAAAGAMEISITGLQRDTKYYYRLRYRTPGSTYFLARGQRTFRTAPPRGTAFAFTVTADPHLDVNTDPALLARTMQNIAADQPDLHIDLGDIFMTDKMADAANILPVYGGGVLPNEARVKTRASIFRTFFEQACHSTPYFYVLGNHEAEYGYAFNAAADKQNNIPAWNLKARKLYYPTPVPSEFYSGNPTPMNYPGGTLGLLENYYAWEWGDALFIVLDPFWNTMSNPNQNEDAWQWSLGRSQYDWLKATLQNSSAAYRFVFLHHIVGGSTTLADGTTPQFAARGGVEVADKYEWGGRNADGSDGFAANRPGWGVPVHQLLVQNKVNVVFHGHDHLYGYQVLDGVTYLECPQPGTANYVTLGSAGDGKYTVGTLLPNSGHIRVTVGPHQAVSEYVRAYRPQDENATRHNQDVAHSFAMAPRVFAPVEMLGKEESTATFRWNAVPNKPYTVQWSSNLLDWSNIDSVTFPAVNTNGIYTDTNASRVNQPRVFYRVSYTP